MKEKKEKATSSTAKGGEEAKGGGHEEKIDSSASSSSTGRKRKFKIEGKKEILSLFSNTGLDPRRNSCQGEEEDKAKDKEEDRRA